MELKVQILTREYVCYVRIQHRSCIMDIGEIIIALAMSLPYGSRIQDPSLLAEILDEVDRQNLSLEDVDPAVDNISDDLVLTDEETIWLRARLREEISRECE